MDEAVKRSRAPDWRMRKLATDIPALRGPCIACADCQGICAELIEVMTLPEAVLRRKREDPET